MIIYEVTLTIDQPIYEDYIAWLKPHIDKMLSFSGFIDVTIYQPDTVIDDQHCLTLHYQINSAQDLDNYFNLHANTMRDEGVSLFEGRFSAKRRILTPVTL